MGKNQVSFALLDNSFIEVSTNMSKTYLEKTYMLFFTACMMLKEDEFTDNCLKCNCKETIAAVIEH